MNEFQLSMEPITDITKKKTCTLLSLILNEETLRSGAHDGAHLVSSDRYPPDRRKDFNLSHVPSYGRFPEDGLEDGPGR
jgi:hypothetical protein